MKIVLYQAPAIGRIQGRLKKHLRDGITNQRWHQQYYVIKEDEDLTWNIGKTKRGKYEKVKEQKYLMSECPGRQVILHGFAFQRWFPSNGSSVIHQKKSQERGWFRRKIRRAVHDIVKLSLEWNIN